MSLFRRFEIIEPSPSIFVRETSSYAPKTLALPHFFPSFPVEDELDFALDLLNPSPTPALIDFTSPFNHFDAITDLIQIEKTPFYTSTKRIQRRVDRFCSDYYLQSISDRVSALERSFDLLAKAKCHSRGDRKYTWEAEIKGAEKYGLDRKYQLTAEIKGAGKKEKGGVEKNYKWKAELKDGGEDSPVTRTYTFKASTGDAGDSSGSDKKEKKKDVKKKKCEKGAGHARVVEIEEPSDHGAIVLRQVRVLALITN